MASENSRLPSSSSWNAVPGRSPRPLPASPARTLASVTAVTDPIVDIAAS